MRFDENVEEVTFHYLSDITITGYVFPVRAYKTITLETSGTSISRTLVFEGITSTGTTVAIPAINLKTNAKATQTTGNNEKWAVDVSDYSYFQVRISAISGGYVTVKGVADLTIAARNKISKRWVGAEWNALGDSITFANVYQPRVVSLCDMRVANNYGLDGQPITYSGSGADGTISSMANQMNFSANLVTVFAGTNDFKLNRPIGTASDSVNTTFYGALKKLVQDIINRNPTQTIALFTPLQRNNAGYNTTSVNSAGHKLIDYVNAMTTVGEMYSIPVLDLYRNSGINELNLSTYTSDGLHPNTTGHNKIARQIASFLERL